MRAGLVSVAVVLGLLAPSSWASAVACVLGGVVVFVGWFKALKIDAL